MPPGPAQTRARALRFLASTIIGWSNPRAETMIQGVVLSNAAPGAQVTWSAASNAEHHEGGVKRRSPRGENGTSVLDVPIARGNTHAPWHRRMSTERHS